MNTLEYIHPSKITPVKPFSPLAKAFEAALMSVDIDGHDSDNVAFELALADAIHHYSLIGLDQRAIIGRLIHHL